MEQLKQQIQAAWANRDLLKETVYQDAVRAVIEEVDKGRLRVAIPAEAGWQVNEWVKKAVVMYFPIQKMEILVAVVVELVIGQLVILLENLSTIKEIGGILVVVTQI